MRHMVSNPLYGPTIKSQTQMTTVKLLFGSCLLEYIYIDVDPNSTRMWYGFYSWIITFNSFIDGKSGKNVHVIVLKCSEDASQHT